jgi:hypothetical protein
MTKHKNPKKTKNTKTPKTVKMDIVEEPIEEIKVVQKCKDKELIIGNTYKITGGKYKKFNICVLQKKNATYSDCELPLKDFNEDEKCLNQIVKIKNLYLLPEQVDTINMPDMDDLKIVDSLDNYFNENPDQKQKFTDMAADKKPNIIKEIAEHQPTPADINKEKDETIIKLKNDNIFLLKEVDNLKKDLLNAIDMSKTNREKELEDTIISVIMAHYN